MKKINSIIYLSLSIMFLSNGAYAKELELEELFTLINSHPEINAAKKRIEAAESAIGVAKSNYLPTLNLEIIDSTGFPGSSGLTGVSGLMGSPYRSGLGYGLVAQETLYDFGRTSNLVNGIRSEANTEKENEKITALNIKSRLVEEYANCALYKTLSETWKKSSEESIFIAKEVKQFIQTGQRSVVERYLVDSQTQEALTESAVFASRSKMAEKIISEIVGKENVECKDLSVQKRNPSSIVESSYILKAKSELETAKSRLSQKKSSYLPKIVAVGSIGNDSKTRLVQKEDFAIAGAIIFPLFDGFKTSNEVHQANAVIEQKTNELEAIQRQINEQDLHYEDQINASQVRLKHLESEIQLAKEGLNAAKSRYLSFEGKLVDIREALRNLFRVEAQQSQAKAELFKASYQKDLLDGVL